MIRLSVCLGIALVPLAARAGTPLEPIAMTGPLRDLNATCVAARKVGCAHATESDTTYDCTCRVLDTVGARGALLIVDNNASVRGAPTRASRGYVLAMRRNDGWWLGLHWWVDRDGAYEAGNCCDGHSGTPWYAVATLVIPGFHDRTLAVEVGIPTWRTPRLPSPGFPRESAPVRRNRDGLLICGVRDTGPACIVTRVPSCTEPARPVFAVVDHTVRARCAGGANDDADEYVLPD